MLNVDSESRSQRVASANEAEATGLAAQIILWLGAALSVGLVAGVVFWAYNLGQRDALDVPVIRALAGLPRERPVDPGGVQVAHQGMAVNEVLGGSESADPVQSAALAPETSGLTADDQPSLPDIETLDSVTPNAESGEVTAEARGTFAPLPSATEQTDTLAEPVAPAETTMLDIPRPVRRETTPGASSDIDAALSDAIAAALAQAETGEAPAALTTTEATPTEAMATLATATEDGPGDTPAVPLGTRMIQLGAFDTEAASFVAWDTLSAAHPQLFATMERFVERRQAGGRVFYRLRAQGCTDLAEARAMCAALLARQVQCITVTARE